MSMLPKSLIRNCGSMLSAIFLQDVWKNRNISSNGLALSQLKSPPVASGLRQEPVTTCFRQTLFTTVTADQTALQTFF